MIYTGVLKINKMVYLRISLFLITVINALKTAIYQEKYSFYYLTRNYIKKKLKFLKKSIVSSPFRMNTPVDVVFLSGSLSNQKRNRNYLKQISQKKRFLSALQPLRKTQVQNDISYLIINTR